MNETARNSLINLEDMSDIDVERMKAAFAAIASNRDINGPTAEPRPSESRRQEFAHRNANDDVAGGDHSDELVVVTDGKCPNIELAPPF